MLGRILLWTVADGLQRSPMFGKPGFGLGSFRDRVGIIGFSGVVRWDCRSCAPVRPEGRPPSWPRDLCGGETLRICSSKRDAPLYVCLRRRPDDFARTRAGAYCFVREGIGRTSRRIDMYAKGGNGSGCTRRIPYGIGSIGSPSGWS